MHHGTLLLQDHGALLQQDQYLHLASLLIQHHRLQEDQYLHFGALLLQNQVNFSIMMLCSKNKMMMNKIKKSIIPLFCSRTMLPFHNKNMFLSYNNINCPSTPGSWCLDKNIDLPCIALSLWL